MRSKLTKSTKHIFLWFLSAVMLQLAFGLDLCNIYIVSNSTLILITNLIINRLSFKSWLILSLITYCFSYVYSLHSVVKMEIGLGGFLFYIFICLCYSTLQISFIAMIEAGLSYMNANKSNQN